MTLFLALASYAHAEDPTFAGTKAAEVAEKPVTKLTANVGGTFTAGNSESVSFNAGLDVSHKWGQNQLGVVGSAGLGFGAIDANADGFLAESERCIGKSDTECAPNTEKYAIDARYDRFFGETSSLYALVGGYHDKFAGFELRVHGQLGYAKRIISNDRTMLKVEAGIDFANEDYVEGVVPNNTKLLAAQVAADFSHTFNENVSFKNALTVYEPLLTQPEGSPFAPYFTDIRVTNTASINAKVSNRLSISVSDTLAWRNEPIAAPTGITESRSPFDNTLTVALVASLL